MPLLSPPWRQTSGFANGRADLEPLILRPIGFFQSRRQHPFEAPRQSQDDRGDGGVIELLPGQQFEQALDGLELFDRIWVLFQFHHNSNWKPMVRPPRGSAHKRGVFSTRAPYRPNPIGLSCVKVLQREGLKIWIDGSDLLDGTPILDLKPYLTDADSFPEANRGWLEGVEENAHTIIWSSLALEQLAWLSEQGLQNLRDFTEQQLEFEPFDNDRKRVQKSGDEKATLAYRTWRIHFSRQAQEITVDSLSSGYSEQDLLLAEDKWQDKTLHREFNERFKKNPRDF